MKDFLSYELVQRFMFEAGFDVPDPANQVAFPKAKYMKLATRLAQYGADQELEACCDLMDDWGLEASDLRSARRPKQQNLNKRISVEIENGTACDRESNRIANDVLFEIAAWADRLGYHSCASELRSQAQ